jgi:hypothetical protein
MRRPAAAERPRVANVEGEAAHESSSPASRRSCKTSFGTFSPALEDVGWFRQLCDRLQLEAEAADVEEYRGYMRDHWRRRFGT